VNFLRKLFGLDRPAAAPVRTKERDFDLKGLERILKYEFRNPALAHTAMTHRSYLHATPGRGGESNERMEFLGDSVVGLAVNEFLYNKFPKLREGELTKMKSLLVSRVILSRTANVMGLGTYVLLSEAENGSGGRARASILADTLEGVIGAVYLDGGLEPARKLTERLLLREVHEILSDANLANYKSMLQEYVQGEFKTHPQYRISSENGPDHQKLFAVEVVVNGKTLGRGHGNNKKEAEQEAARDALLQLEKIVRGEKSSDSGTAESERRRRRRGGRGRRSRNGGSGEGMEPRTGESRGREERAGRIGREPRSGRGSREGRERRAPRDGQEPREGREPREPREGREEGREHREPREGRPPREPREHREPRENREPRESHDTPRAHEEPTGGSERSFTDRPTPERNNPPERSGPERNPSDHPNEGPSRTDQGSWAASHLQSEP
jgi:ribonuclease-3